MKSHKIIIENLKGIERLVFEFPSTGVHVISAANGSGKTTLLVCLERIFNTRALNTNFKQHNAANVDPYENAKITYQNSDGRSVTYTYRTISDTWKATTRSRNVLESIYTSIQYMPTLGKRVYVQSNAKSRNDLVAANRGLKEAMAEVLEDNKFLKLLKGNIGETRGRKGGNRRENTAYRLPLGRKQIAGVRKHYFYSELSFSLGEIFVLNLLHRIQNIKEGTLVLVDELEVALHPRVQLKLLRYLEKIAIERNLTILVSTHSSSLIKCAKNLIFLERNTDGIVNVFYNCYPTYALRDVGILEDIYPDYVFYVEDKMAESLLRLIIEKYFELMSIKVKPLWKVLPIGGYAQVLNFGKRSKDYLLPSSIAQYLFLDEDVKDEKQKLKILGNGRSEAQQKLWELFTELDSRIRYLEITPELGLWNWIESNVAKTQDYFNDKYSDRVLDISREINQCNIEFPIASSNLRNDAKNKINWIGKQLGNLIGIEKDKLLNEMFNIYCEYRFTEQIEINKLKTLFGPIFSHRSNF